MGGIASGATDRRPIHKIPGDKELNTKRIVESPAWKKLLFCTKCELRFREELMIKTRQGRNGA
jgi:hypothetical protein